MIDSIVLRVHNLEKHCILYHQLNTIRNGAAFTVLEPKLKPLVGVPYGLPNFELVTDLDPTTGELVKRPISVQPFAYKSYYYDEEDTNERQRGRVGTYELQSGHYDVRYMIDDDKDCINFSVSVPKILYGTNVFQAVEDCYYPNFWLDKNSQIKYNAGRTYNLLMQFIDKFFKLLFAGVPVDFKCLEIARIDICYNQIFPTEAAARDYLANAKAVRKKHQRKGFMNNFANDNVLYSNNQYGFKIYHKGDEFSKRGGDYRQMLDLNSAAKKVGLSPIYNTAKILNLANRTVRYELTVHSKFMSYLFQQYICRKDCPIHVLRWEHFRDCEKKARYSRMSDEDLAQRKSPPYSLKEVNFTRREQAFYSAFSSATNKRLHFFHTIKASEKVFYSNSIDVGEKYCLDNFDDLDEFRTAPNAPFSPELLGLCIGKLFSYVDEYKLETRPQIDTIAKAVANYNNTQEALRLKYQTALAKTKSPTEQTSLKAKIKDCKIIRFSGNFCAVANFMDEGYGFDEACEHLKLPARTKYDVKTYFEKCGLSTRAVLESALPYPMGFRDYHLAFQDIRPRKFLPILE